MKDLFLYIAIGISLVIFGGLIFLRTYVYEPIVVAGDALYPEYYSGDYLFANKMYKELNIGDIVTYTDENSSNGLLIGKIIGNEADKEYFVNNSIITLKENELLI